MKRALFAAILVIFASQQATASDQSSRPLHLAYLGVQLPVGALIGHVNDHGPAQIAGIEPGDLVVRFDDKEIRNSDDLIQTIAATAVGKVVMITISRNGVEGTVTATLGQRLVLTETALAELRQKLSGMLTELKSLGAAKGNWSTANSQKFSELLEQFDKQDETAPLGDSEAYYLWDQLGREFALYQSIADDLRRRREAHDGRQDQSHEIEEKLSPLYLNYMTLQTCISRFREFDDVKTRLRDFLKDKETPFPRALRDELWNSVAVKFQKVETALEQTGAAQLYVKCDQVRQQATAFMTPNAGERLRPPLLRKKDF